MATSAPSAARAAIAVTPTGGAGEAVHVVVVGGGISGLSAAERMAAGGARVTVVEASGRVGGIMATERVGELVLERGADSVVAAKPATRELCERLGIADRLVGPAARGAFVYRDGQLRRLPAGLSGLMPTRLGPLATSRLLSTRGLARAALEPWQPVPPDAAADESLESFVTRRVGREAYERLVEPLLAGIYAGDGRRLSVAATFPQLREVERAHGSLVRGLRARSRATAVAGSAFLSMPGGLQEIVDALEAALVAGGRVTVRRHAPVRAVVRPGADGRARVVLEDGSWIAADAVVVATPAPRAARLLAGEDAALAAELGAIAHGSTATVTLAVDRAAVPHALDATGYIIPRVEGRDALACTFVSSKWAGRAPADVALFRVFVGGAHRAELVERDDADLVAIARRELRETLGVATMPRLARVGRWLGAMPQYELGHPERVARIARLTAAHPWLAIAGNAYAGVGIPDCIRSGQAAADRLLGALAPASAGASRAA
jgi:oxygen-dependent protoporphyrinogen oxidase